MPQRYHPHSKPATHIQNLVLDAFNAFHPMSADLINAFREKSFEVNLSKGSYLLRQGDLSNYMYFLMAGIVTGYRNNGQEKLTTFISVAGDFVSAIDGMYGTAPVEDNMVAASDCYLIAIRTETLLEFFDAFPEMNIIMRKILEIYYREAHQRSVIMRMGNAKEKYGYYLKNLSSKTEEVPLPLIASFLDMKTETLKNIIREQSKTGATKSDTENLFRLQNLISTELLFLEKRIRLKTIAQRVDLTPHELSALLNNHYRKSFADFINIFRVNYVKEKLRKNDALQQITIEALGNQAGFSSKSNFFLTFKKHTGMSPMEYIRNGKLGP